MTCLYNVGDIVFLPEFRQFGVIIKSNSETYDPWFNKQLFTYNIIMYFEKDNKVYEKLLYNQKLYNIHKFYINKNTEKTELIKILLLKSNLIKLQKS